MIKILEATIEHQKTVWNLYNYLIDNKPELKDCISLTAKSLYPNSEGNETHVRFDLVIELGNKLIVVEVKSNPEDWGKAIAQVTRYRAIIRENGLFTTNQHKQPATILPIIILSTKPVEKYMQEAIAKSGFNIFIFDQTKVEESEATEYKNPDLDRLLELVRGFASPHS